MKRFLKTHEQTHIQNAYVIQKYSGKKERKIKIESRLFSFSLEVSC